MTLFFRSIEIELANLVQLEKNLLEDPLVPEKCVITTRRTDNRCYYVRIKTLNGKRKVKYIGDANSEELHKMARSSYKHELMALVRNNIKVLKKVLAEYSAYSRADVLAKLSPCLQDVLFNTDFDIVMKKLKEWATDDYKRNPAPFKGGVIRAKNGTRVRSKSECVIYNLLLEAGIPFRYDSVIELKRKNKYGEVETFYESPDFLIKCPNGKLIIIEHAGILASIQYTNDLSNKLQTYQLNGYRLGYTLFVTNDDINGGVDSQEISDIIDYIKMWFPYM